MIKTHQLLLVTFVILQNVDCTINDANRQLCNRLYNRDRLYNQCTNDYIYNKQYTRATEISNSIYFSLNTYRTLYDPNENFAFSPFSLRVIYNTIFQVAFGPAEEILEEMLFENYNLSFKDRLLYGQRDNMWDVSFSRQIQLANKLYYSNKNGRQLNSDINFATKFFEYQFEQIDFGNQQETIDVINNWADNQTNGMIRDIVDAKTIKPDTQIVFINTVYFKAKWLNPYKLSHKFTHDFNSNDGTIKPIDFIVDTSHYQLSFNNQYDVKVLELPYELRISRFVFWIMLPNSSNSGGVTRLVNRLDKTFFTTINNCFRRRYTRVKFPMFTIESELDGKLISPEAFEHPNFHVFDNTNSEVDRIQHKTKIIVDLDGTEGASATSVSFNFGSSMVVGDETIEFVADRPFVYAVLKKETLQPIFLGHFVKA